jgi:hypothetical protein
MTASTLAEYLLTHPEAEVLVDGQPIKAATFAYGAVQILSQRPAAERSETSEERCRREWEQVWE